MAASSWPTCVDLRSAREGPSQAGEATNGDLSVTGIVLGIIGLLIAIGIVVFGVSILNSPAG